MIYDNRLKYSLLYSFNTENLRALSEYNDTSILHVVVRVGTFYSSYVISLHLCDWCDFEQILFNDSSLAPRSAAAATISIRPPSTTAAAGGGDEYEIVEEWPPDEFVTIDPYGGGGGVAKTILHMVDTVATVVVGDETHLNKAQTDDAVVRANDGR